MKPRTFKQWPQTFNDHGIVIHKQQGKLTLVHGWKLYFAPYMQRQVTVTCKVTVTSWLRQR